MGFLKIPIQKALLWNEAGVRQRYVSQLPGKTAKTEGRDPLPPAYLGVRPVQDPDGSDLKKPVGNRIKTWKLVPSYYRCKKDKERCGL